MKIFGRDKEEIPIADLIGATDFFSHDLVIIPYSQLPMEMDEVLNMTQEEIAAAAAKAEAEAMAAAAANVEQTGGMDKAAGENEAEAVKSEVIPSRKGRRSIRRKHEEAKRHAQRGSKTLTLSEKPDKS